MSTPCSSPSTRNSPKRPGRYPAVPRERYLRGYSRVPREVPLDGGGLRSARCLKRVFLGA
eukprot:3887154-Rhodomonas_salina.1